MRGGILVRNLGVYIVSDIIDERDGWVLVRYIVGYHLWGGGNGFRLERFTIRME